MKTILSWERHARKIRDSRISLLGCEKPEQLRLKKYFPKFLRELSLKSADHSTITKIKSIKRVSYLNTSGLSGSCLKESLILGNKARLAKSLRTNHQSHKSFAERVALFSNLESITIRPHSIYDEPSLQEMEEEQDLVEVCKRMRHLKKLKALEIKELAKDQKNFIGKLNSSPRLLKSLKSFNVFCRFEENPETSAETDSLEIIEILQRSKTLLKKYITELDLGVLCSNLYFFSFQGFANACPKLSSLSLSFHNKRLATYFHGTRSVRRPFQVKVNYLKTVETFQSLKSLNLHIGDTLTFLKDFAVLSSLKSLELAFEEQFSKEIMRKIDKSYTEAQVPRIFEEHEVLLRFYEKFQKLKNLDSLELLFSDNSSLEAYRCQSYFVRSLLKRISTVKKLVVGPLCSLLCLLNNSNRVQEIYDPYLPQFLGSCEGFGQMLETLQVGYQSTVYSYINLSSSHGKFPKLSTVQISGRFSGDWNEISDFLSQIISLGDAMTMIRLNALLTKNTVEVLLSFLRQINQLQKPDKLRIELHIGFAGAKDLEDLGNDFESMFVELDKRKKSKGVSVKLYTDVCSD